MRRWLLVLAVLAGLVPVDARQTGSLDLRTAPLTEPIPTDPLIRIGTLPNGLRYYIRQNRRPEQRAELRLVVKAGSVLEDDDQRGLAHIVEHMAFQGTLNFPGRSLSTFLSSLGESIGPDANAGTSFDETVYRLRVPLDRPRAMEQALLVLDDWLHNISFDAAAIARERAVVTEEWRLRLGAVARIRDLQAPIIFAGSRYATRSPIGDPDSLQSFKPERLIQFYRDWYRPDLSAVVAVGDFDPSAVEQQIRARFAPLPAAVSPRPVPVFEVPDQAGTRYAVLTDRELPATTAQVISLLPARDRSSIGSYRSRIVDRLSAAVLNARFSEVVLAGQAPFITAAHLPRGPFARTKEQSGLLLIVKEGEIERSLTAAMAEVQRVLRFGVTPGELERQKETMLRQYERAAAETDTRDSSTRANQYVSHFLANEILPRAADEHVLHQRFLPQIISADVTAALVEAFSDRNRIVLVTAPDKAGSVLPDEARLAAAVRLGTTASVTAYTGSGGSRTLVSELPAPGSVAGTKTHGDTGVTEWTLSNGARVVLKPTTFKEDEILFRASAPGGTSLASDEDYISASASMAIIPSGGVGALNVNELQQALAGHIASATPFANETSVGVSGSASRRDLERLLQLVHLRFTQPRADRNAFAVASGMARVMSANQLNSPEFALQEALASALSQDHPRRRLPTAAAVEQWDLDRALRFYRERFADASGFTFVFVGSFDLDTMKPLVERYLASLPSSNRKETWRDLGIRPPSNVVEKTVMKGIEPKAQVVLTFTGPFEYDRPHQVALRAVGAILGGRLQASLRQQLGATYSISVATMTTRIPYPHYSLRIQWSCDPERVEELAARVFAEIEQVKRLGFGLVGLRAQQLATYQAGIQTNAYLLQEILRTFDEGGDVSDIWRLPDYIAQLEMPAFNRAARTYLDTTRYVRVTLLPEKR